MRRLMGIRPCAESTRENRIAVGAENRPRPGDVVGRTMSMIDAIRQFGKGLLAVAARPVSRSRSARGIALLPYRGYGSREEMFLIGRVFRQGRGARKDKRRGVPGLLRNVARRITRRAVPGMCVVARFGDASERVVTDGDGYFRVHLRLAGPPPDDTCWHAVSLSLEDAPVAAEAQVFVPPSHCRFVVISDIDDTVVETGVANTLPMLWRLFVADAKSRTAFPGVAALYRGLHEGRSGSEHNPMLYVSRAPWGTYEVLEEFFHLHGIPVGPVLFLREWGVTWSSPWPRRARDHKEDLIERMLALYAGLPFLLIGDSGQHDPEIYARIVERHPGRVLTVMIRDVSRDRARTRAIEDLARSVAAAGSSLLLAADSVAMARHVAAAGLMADAVVGRAAQERHEEDPACPDPATPTVALRDGEGAVDSGAVKAVREAEAGPVNLVVGGGDARPRP
jgi:phosphatidate phosphatase APP1